MIKAKVYNIKGEVVREDELDGKFFGLTVKPLVVQQAVEAQQANSRQVLAHAKGRSEVKGGGRKPWRQKGTGRARHGSIRSPLWRGGGITFGPTKERNFAKGINKKAKKLALRMALADKVNNQLFILLDELKLDTAKTKKMAEIIKNLPINGKTALIALASKDENIIRSSRNLVNVDTLPVNSLNIVDVLKFQYLIIPVKAIKKLIETYS